MNNNPLTIIQILGALKRNKFVAFSTWLLVMVVVVAAFLAWPRTYGSEAGLYVKVGRNNAGITPGSGTTSVTIQDTRETEIRSVVSIMGSPAVIEAVVAEVGAGKILESRWDGVIPSISIPNFFGSKAKDSLTIESYDELKRTELAIKKLGSDMSVQVQKKTSIITVFIKASSSKLAQQLVASVLKHTDAVHMKVHAAEGSMLFFAEELEKQKELVANAESKLAEYRDELKVVSVGDERATLQSILSRLQTELLTAETQLVEANSRLEKLQDVMESTEPLISVPTTGVERLSYEDSRTEIFRLESELERASSLYRPTHPEVIQRQEALDSMKESLGTMPEDRTESVTTSNPVFEEMQVDFLRAKVEQVAAASRVEGLQKQQSRAFARLPGMNAAAIKAQEHQRNIQIAESELFIYSQKGGEAKAMASLDDQQISDLKVNTQPTFRLKHISPKGSLIVPLGFICGLFAALCVVLFRERNHLSANYNEGEVEQILDLPVLVTLPRVYSSRNMVN
ncbi:MAG: hypothetical protein ACI87E_001230 [Mariniblastus sp.]|jgi:uncharacterized protein involved in exopolysaccharide biosynthesis